MCEGWSSCLRKGVELNVVLSIQEERVVQSDWTVVWQNRWFQLESVERKRQLVKKRVQVCRLLDGTIRWQYRGCELKWKELPARPAKVRVTVEVKGKRKTTKWKPGANHPWRGKRAVV